MESVARGHSGRGLQYNSLNTLKTQGSSQPRAFRETDRRTPCGREDRATLGTKLNVSRLCMRVPSPLIREDAVFTHIQDTLSLAPNHCGSSSAVTSPGTC